MSYIGNTKIGKMYLGNIEIAKAYLGNTLVFQNTPPTLIPYIRGGADGSYIDTGITADNTTKIIIWARNFNVGTGWLFGSRISAGQSSFGLGSFVTNGGCWQFDFNSINRFYDIYSYSSHFRRYELSSEGLKVDGVTIQSLTPSTFSSGVNIHLFGMNTNGTHTNPNYSSDIIACKIYKNETLVRDYSVVNAPSIGLYDAVSDTVFTNAGSGSFSYGTFNPSAYTPLEYIECDKQQYFDSGVYGSENIRVITKFRMTSTDKKYSRLFGCRNNENTIMCELMIGNESYDNRYYFMRYAGESNTVYNTASQTGNDLVFTATGNAFGLYKNNSSLGTKTGASGTFTTPQTMYVGTSNIAGYEQMQYAFYGRIYYLSLDAQHIYVPAKVNNVFGLYDTYNDVFHPSESGTPFVAGPRIPSVTDYFRNKKIAIIGDSISTYDLVGYKYDSYRMYYPAGDVDTVDETWWKLLMDKENCTLDVNLAYSGSFSSNYNQNYPTFYDRTGLITDAEIIIVAIGTNDSSNSVPLGTFDYTTEPTNLDMSKFRESYIKGIRSLMTLYPSASIVCAIFSMGSDYRESIKTIAEHYGLVVVDCGNDYEKYTTVHPNANGMIQIYSNFLF